MKKVYGILFFFLSCVWALPTASQPAVKLGTHNSLTYLKPHGWLRWLNFTAKCQNLTIEEQYEFGARYFDFRFKFTRKGVRAAHGPIIYKANFDSIFSFLNGKKDCIVNVVLEQKRKKDAEFINYVDWLIRRYPDIRFVGGERKYPWENVLPLGNVSVKPCYECFAGECMKFPLPRKYAKRNNRRYWEEVNQEAYSIFDFIEIGSIPFP